MPDTARIALDLSQPVGAATVRQFDGVTAIVHCAALSSPWGPDAALPKPVNAYARTKAIAESRVAQSGLPCTILRPRGIYGRGDTGLLPRLLRTE